MRDFEIKRLLKLSQTEAKTMWCMHAKSLFCCCDNQPGKNITSALGRQNIEGVSHKEQEMPVGK